MKIIYTKDPVSLIKAVLYAEFTHGTLVPNDHEALSLFNEPAVDANDLDIEDLIKKLRLALKKPEFFSNPEHIKALQELLVLGLRHSSKKRYEITENAVRATLHKSMMSIANGTTAEGKALQKLATEVQGEVRLAGQQMKFSILPQGENVLYTRYQLQHDTADLVVKLWSKVYPAYTFVILLPDKTIIGNRHGIEEWDPYYGAVSALAKKIASANILNHPQRSRLAAQHASFVQTDRALPFELPHLISVNYIDFYNKIKRGEIPL